ncbi:hypothetical protein K501DRAFT_269578 [Backusella circina FSU 941]|nr:hypothetical protein K501DRAFT_269578 [Backusella circina FSU 941]
MQITPTIFTATLFSLMSIISCASLSQIGKIEERTFIPIYFAEVAAHIPLNYAKEFGHRPLHSLNEFALVPLHIGEDIVETILKSVAQSPTGKNIENYGLVKSGTENFEVFGMFVQKSSFLLYTLDLKFGGIYRYIEVEDFYLAGCFANIVYLTPLSLVKRLEKMKFGKASGSSVSPSVSVEWFRSSVATKSMILKSSE